MMTRTNTSLFAGLTALVVMVALIAVAAGALLQGNTLLQGTGTPVSPSIQSQIDALQGETASIRQQLDALSNAAASKPDSSLDMIALRADLKLLDDRLSVIERAVLSNPEKALQLALLDQQMDNLKTTYHSDLESTRQEIARMYDLNKWFIALMFTIALSILGLALSNLIRRPERASEKEAESLRRKQ